jgi:hypothetical protein
VALVISSLNKQVWGEKSSQSSAISRQVVFEAGHLNPSLKTIRLN